MGCNKTTNICSNPILSTCVDHEGELGKHTKIKENCISQYAINKDLYSLVDEIKEEVSTKDLGGSCISYEETEGEILFSAVIKKYEEEICNLKSEIDILKTNSIGDVDISGLGLNFECLVDSCGDPITNLKDLLQSIITKTCE